MSYMNESDENEIFAKFFRMVRNKVVKIAKKNWEILEIIPPTIFKISDKVVSYKHIPIYFGILTVDFFNFYTGLRKKK